jgi:hypothetical protein
VTNNSPLLEIPGKRQNFRPVAIDMMPASSR